MSDRVYLQSITIKDFRTFGDFSIDLPPGPGLTLLAGTNGLGKSSFFDAVEWGLTGRVRRLQQYLTSIDEADYLLRRGARGPHGVTLGFTEGDPLTRRGDNKPQTAQVIDLLRRPDWGAQIQDVGTYLAFTHFLGQAEPQRFTSREKGEQWASLKGPSGIERLEEVRKGLRGRATQLALTRRVKQDSEAVEDLKRQLQTWQTWRTRLARLRDASGAAGGLAAAELDRRLAELDTDLRQAGWALSPAPTGETRSQALGRLKAAIDAARITLTGHQRTLQGVAEIPERYAVNQAAIRTADAALVAANGKVEQGRTILAATQAEFAKAQSGMEAAIRELARARAKLTAADAIRQDLEAIAAMAARLTEAAARKADLEAALAVARAAIVRFDLEIPRLRGLLELLVSRRAQADAASQLAAQARGLAGLQLRAQQSAETAAALETTAVEARTSLASFLEARSHLQSEREGAKAALVAARERATGLAAAVAQVASHLHVEDQDCPVCRSHFPVGVLQDLARRAADAQSAELAAAEANDARLGLALEQNAAATATARAAISNAEAARRTADTDAAAVRQQRERLEAALPEAGDELVAAALAAETAASENLAEVAARASTAEADLAAALAARQVAVAELGELGARLEAAGAIVAQFEIDQRSLEERVAASTMPDATPESAADLVRVRTLEVATQEEAHASATALLAAARGRVDAAREQADAATQASATAEAARKAELEAATALEIRWRGAALEPPITAAQLEGARGDAALRLTEVERLEDRRSELLAANDMADRDRELQALIDEMEAVGGVGAGEDAAMYEAQLEAQMTAAREIHRHSRDARVAVRAFSEKLRDEANKFSTQFLAPLNDLIGGFNEALLSAPGDSVRFQADTRVDTTNFDMGLQYRDPIDNALYNKNLPPQAFLSEGQLAANGFSILCAASTAYPWSKWRSLLLDDPLQHNDIIHAAAFVDLMRNLVELEGYQLIMSTHDRAEGDFIARKFDAAGLPCKVVSLTAPSKFGVRYEEPPPNPAAQALLRRPVEKSA